MRSRARGRLRPCGSPPVLVKRSDDWDQLFDALKERLCQLAGSEPGPALPADLLPAALRDCAQALDCLHNHFALETGRRRRLELDAFDARVARVRGLRPRPASATLDRLCADGALTDTPELRP